jgi:Transposase domain (DUF772)
VRGLFSYVDMEERVSATHPVRTIRTIVNEVRAGAAAARPLLQAFYSVRSERQLMEQINYNLLLRWFVGLGIDNAVWDHSTFSKNRDRLLGADVTVRFLAAVLRHPKGHALSVGRALLGRRHAGESLGFDQELPRQGRFRRATWARAQRRTALPPREASWSIRRSP